MDLTRFMWRLKKIKSISFKELVFKLCEKSLGKIIEKLNQFKDSRTDTHLSDNEIKVNFSYIDSNSLDISGIDKVTAKYLCHMYLSHNFDLLGSGWINISYDMQTSGIEGHSYDMSPHISEFDIEGNWLAKIILEPHLGFSREIWKLIDREYMPIDWQMDFKSGYRFSQKKWYKNQPIGKDPGVDIKVPWELSRMQHLPQMAVFSLVLPNYRERIIREFKNQVLDFIMTNPLRMGVNWTCTMDVGIRTANLLLAFDILKQLDYEGIMNEEFCFVFSNSIFEHGEFIVQNLEWNHGNHGNHYLGDISGLLFATAYLERSETTDAWLSFAVQELIDIVQRQFYEDGSNFESSTSYHRLSTEMIIFDTALIYGILKSNKVNALKEYNFRKVKRLKPLEKQNFSLIKGKFFPERYLSKLFKAGCFTVDISKPNGVVPQIGDNDSGRLFKFSPIGEFLSVNSAALKYENLKFYKEVNLKFQKHWDENILNHSTLISAVNGLFNNRKFRTHSSKFPLEKSLVESISKGFKDRKTENYHKVLLVDGKVINLKFKKITEFIFEKYTNRKIDILNIRLVSYPCFGLYILKSDNFYACIMAGSNSKFNNGAHKHEDRLSFELNIGGRDIFTDPGTYVYTPIPEKRNYFRSKYVHNVPIVKEDKKSEVIELFSLKDDAVCYVVDASNDYIKLQLIQKDIFFIRELKVLEDRLIINDSCNKDFIVNFNKCTFHSNGYGKLLN